jgi:thiol-disulfide isomerase/thioredoxin
MWLQYLLLLLFFLHSTAYSSELNQQEGICGPDVESAKECIDPSLNSNTLLSPDIEENTGAETFLPSKKAPRPESQPSSKTKENYSPTVKGDQEKSSIEHASPQKNEFVVHFFWGSGCPHCKEEKVFLNEMKKIYPHMKVMDYEVWYDRENASLLSKMSKAYNIKAAGVPVTFIGKNIVVGFSEHSKKELSEFFQVCSAAQCLDPSDVASGKLSVTESPAVIKESKTGDLECTEKGKTVYIPWIGSLDSSQMSLPVITMVIAGLDSFNPCAFFVLLSLLGLLIHAQSRKKMFLIGSVFVFFSGFIYFLFMAAWLNLFLVMGQVEIITKIAGSIAVVIAVINIKDFFIFKRGVSLTIPDSAKPKLFDRMRKLLKSTSVISILIGTAVLAIAANAYELLCTAGFPMVFTRILTLNNLSSDWYYLYLILYNVIYVIPLSLIVIIFTVTLGRKHLTERQGRLMKLVSGTMMLALGGVLLINPTVLSNAFISFILLIGALLVSLVIAGITYKIKPT